MKTIKLDYVKLDKNSNKNLNYINSDIKITITVDNNRYGSSYKCFEKFEFIILNFSGGLKKLYHFLVENYVKKGKWANTEIGSFKNMGTKTYSLPTINYECLKYL